MDIETLRDICIKFPDVRIKAIKDEQLTEHYNTGYGSWRYEYSEPALFFNGDGYMTLKDLVPYLDSYPSVESKIKEAIKAISDLSNGLL